MPPLNSAFVPHLGREVKFQDRSSMRPPFVGRAARLPSRAGWEPPVTPLPVDSTGDARVQCPMLGNDQYGDCGPVMLAHRLQILAFRRGQGRQLTVDKAALVRQYLRVSGGDNGIGEPQAIQILKEGVAGTSDDSFLDALDVDPTNVPLTRFLIDQFGTLEVGWSVPDAFRSGFATGSVWPRAMRPNPRLGHYTPIADVGTASTPIPKPDDPTGGGRTRLAMLEALAQHGGCPFEFAADKQTLGGFYRLWTWGGWAWIGPDFLASVNPDGFVVFSTALFDPATGLDAKGRHVTTQAVLWQKCGGHPIPAAALAKYPPAPPDHPAISWAAWD